MSAEGKRDQAAPENCPPEDLKPIARHDEAADLRRYLDAAEAKISSKLVPLIRPQDVSDMSLTEAAFWIATEGGKYEFCVTDDTSTWKLAFGKLLNPIINNAVDLWGCRAGVGLPEKVPGNALINILIDYPYQEWSDFIFGSDPYLECYGILDGDHWRNGSDDKLFSRWRQLEWGQLRLKSVDVLRHWSFEGDAEKDDLRSELERAYAKSEIKAPLHLRDRRHSSRRPMVSRAKQAELQKPTIGLKKRTTAQKETLRFAMKNIGRERLIGVGVGKRNQLIAEEVSRLNKNQPQKLCKKPPSPKTIQRHFALLLKELD